MRLRILASLPGRLYNPRLGTASLEGTKRTGTQIEGGKLSGRMTGKSMGLDLGEKTIGIAVSDDLGWTAQPLRTLKRKALREDIEQILLLARESRVDRIVIGLPRNMDGSIGIQGQRAQRFSETLQNQSELMILTWDERLSTVAAERVLLQADMSRKKRKQHVDKLAAAFILQGYLDSLGWPARRE